jgi:hypothetical protein
MSRRIVDDLGLCREDGLRQVIASTGMSPPTAVAIVSATTKPPVRIPMSTSGRRSLPTRCISSAQTSAKLLRSKLTTPAGRAIIRFRMALRRSVNGSTGVHVAMTTDPVGWVNFEQKLA